MTTRFLLVEDHEPLAKTLANAARCIGRVDVATTVARGVALVGEHDDWTGFVIDVVLPDGNGLDVLDAARRRGFDAPALVLTGRHDAATINRAFELDGRYLVKPADPFRILTFFSEAARRPTLAQCARQWGERYDLTETEIAVLRSAAEGSPRERLAFERGIAETTLKKHVHNLLRKTGDASLLAAAARLLRDRDRDR